MVEWSEYAKFLAGLLSIINPIGAIPLFIGMTTGHDDEDRPRIARTAALAAALVLWSALLLGEVLLAFFGISISSFRVGGGLLLLLMAVSMMHARTSGAKQTAEEEKEAHDKNSVAVVPLGIPLIAGPGSISTVILYAHKSTTFSHYLVLGAGILLVALIVWVALRAAPLVADAVGRTGINIATRVMGLIMAAIGVEFIASGLKGLFPALGGGL